VLKLQFDRACFQGGEASTNFDISNDTFASPLSNADASNNDMNMNDIDNDMNMNELPLTDR